MVLLELSSEEEYDFPMMGYDFARPMGIWFPDWNHIYDFTMGYDFAWWTSCERNWFPDGTWSDEMALYYIWDMILLGELPVNGNDIPMGYDFAWQAPINCLFDPLRAGHFIKITQFQILHFAEQN